MLVHDVTVLLPARNAEATIGAAVRSVLADAGQEAIRVLAIDDASTDSTRRQLDALAHADDRVEVIAGPGRGLVAALELGWQQIHTPLVARMDADDLWLPGRLQAQLETLGSDPSLAAVGGEVEVFSDTSVGEGMRRYAAWINASHRPGELHRERYVESPLVHPAVMMRRLPIEAVGGYRDGPFPEDYELWLRLLASGAHLGNVAHPVLRWRDSASRLTRTHPNYNSHALRGLKVRFLLEEPFARGPLWIAGAGPTGLPLARALRAGGARIERFIDVHPRKIGTRIDGVPVVAYDDLAGPGEAHLLVAVGVAQARQEVREFLAPRGWSEGADFTCIA